MARFVVILFLVALAFIGVAHGLLAELPSFFYEILGLLFLGTIAVHFFTLRIKRGNPTQFPTLYTKIPVAKLILYGAATLFIVWLDKDHAAENMATFAIIYLSFTALEIYFSYRRG